MYRTYKDLPDLQAVQHVKSWKPCGKVLHNALNIGVARCVNIGPAPLASKRVQPSSHLKADTVETAAQQSENACSPAAT